MDDRDRVRESRSQTSRLWRTSSSFEQQQQRLQSRANADAPAEPATPAAATLSRSGPAADPSSATSAATAMLTAIAAQQLSCNLGRTTMGGEDSAGLTPLVQPAAAGSAAAAADCLPSRSVAHTSASGVMGIGGDLQVPRLWQAYEQKQKSSSMFSAAAGSAAHAPAAGPAAPPTAVLDHTQQNWAGKSNTQKADSDSHIGVDGSSCSQYRASTHRGEADSSRGGRSGGCLRVRLPDGHHIRRVTMTATLTAANAEGRKTEFR